MWVAVAVALYVFGPTAMDRLAHILPEPATASPTGNPCPAEARPDGAEATLIASYTTVRHTIVLCRTASGLPYYDGRFTDRPVTKENHINIRAEETPEGFLAVNGDYSYRISGDYVTITGGGKRETLRLTKTG
ncbi:hypothetical protein CLV40_107259 [Actinokineospora auranticolor]|uniref:Uncharacterized protein n=1 Tax=Actinokineospora auranticolor TaxID=155976 RepID=A0A2S6GQZ4_9PSEU|nr:hypothetical protein CLV40_107259 [Actinokineospora auranticolor]